VFSYAEEICQRLIVNFGPTRFFVYFGPFIMVFEHSSTFCLRSSVLIC